MAALVLAEGVAVLLLAVLVAGLLRSHAEILKSLHELGAGVELDGAAAGGAGRVDVEIEARDIQVRPGVSAPRLGGTDEAFDLTGVTLDDDLAAVAVTGTGHDTLLAFLSSGCSSCQTFWSAFAEQPVRVPGGARLVVVVKDLADESESTLRKLAPEGLPVVASSQAWDDYGVPGSPYFVYVSGTRDKVAGEGSAGTWQAVADLMRQAAEDGAAEHARHERATARGLVRQSTVDRDAGAEEALAAAGIGPGHPSLYAAPDDRSTRA